jgi:hypothetical protein
MGKGRRKVLIEIDSLAWPSRVIICERKHVFQVLRSCGWGQRCSKNECSRCKLRK